MISSMVSTRAAQNFYNEALRQTKLLADGMTNSTDCGEEIAWVNDAQNLIIGGRKRK
jgi:hypothetical protein